jgi:hypothetical protein
MGHSQCLRAVFSNGRDDIVIAPDTRSVHEIIYIACHVPNACDILIAPNGVGTHDIVGDRCSEQPRHQTSASGAKGEWFTSHFSQLFLPTVELLNRTLAPALTDFPLSPESRRDERAGVQTANHRSRTHFLKKSFLLLEYIYTYIFVLFYIAHPSRNPFAKLTPSPTQHIIRLSRNPKFSAHCYQADLTRL